MLTMLLQRMNLKKFLISLLFTVILAGCTSSSEIFMDTLKNDANASSDFYLRKAQNAPEVMDKNTYLLLAARVLVTENKIAQAEATLAELEGVELEPAQLLDKSLVEASIAAAKKEDSKADTQLRMINLALLSPSQKSRYYQIVADLAEHRADVIEAVRARINIDATLTDSKRKQANNDAIWSLLRNANKGLINTTEPMGEVALAGWIALIQAYNNNIAQPAKLSSALQSWKASYPNHSAALLFPTELQEVFSYQTTQVSQIGLLLPLSGDAQLIGNTIKAGFDDAKGESELQVQVFDTVATPIETIVEQAKTLGIKTLVGPLLKNNVDIIINNSGIQGVNILALNSTPNSRAVGQVCYYGLAPEDEAESAANKMWNDGIRQPLVIVPQNDLGQRTAAAFNLRWQQLTSTDANIRFYTQPDDIAYALQENLNQGLQAMYIVALSEELANLKGTIDANNVNNLQIYASSRSNSGNNTPEYRMLMDGMQFSEIPFFKDTETEQYKKVETLTNGDFSLMRLYAMGADSWTLINQFNELRQVPGYSVSGLTGVLSAGPNCNIERQMTWMQYKNGEIKVLN